MKIGYARVSTHDQDLAVQIEQLEHLGVRSEAIYTDHGFTGRNTKRPGLENALKAVREGDELVVTKLDRLARSLKDAQGIAEQLQTRGVALNIGGSMYDPHDPMGKMLFTLLGMFAEFESDLIRQRTKEGMAIAKKNGRLKGKQPKLTAAQARTMVELYDKEDSSYTIAMLAQTFNVGRSTVYRTLERGRAAQPKSVE